MSSSLSRKQIQKIAFRVKYECEGCPEFISYYDIKDELTYGSHLRSILIDTNNRNELFSVKLLSAEIQDALSNLESGLDDWDRRRVALFHGMVQFPSLLDPSLKSSLIKKLNELDSRDHKNEYAYIFLSGLLDRVSPNNDMSYRKKLLDISNILEGDDPKDSLFAHFLKLINLSVRKTMVKTNSIEGGGYFTIPKKESLIILFDFEDYDFQDVEFIGGAQFLGNTSPLPLRKKIILKQLEELRGLNLNDSIEFFY